MELLFDKSKKLCYNNYRKKKKEVQKYFDNLVSESIVAHR